MSETTKTTSGIADVIDLALTATEPHPLEEGSVYAVAVPPNARVEVLDRDLDKYRTHPRRARGRYTVRTAASLIEYLAKHSLPQTELWADVDAGSITAVINAHSGADAPAGWEDHRAVLQLVHTPAWLAWSGISGKLLRQVEFAEFIEQRTVDFTNPSGADVLELAQSFQAARAGRFESSQRLSSGETNLVWTQEVQAAAGKSGQIAIPDVLELALIPFQGGPAYKVTARLRYRMDSGALLLGVVLERPEDVIRDAFDAIVAEVDEAVDQAIFAGNAPA
jgi:uncharacterized protein YfdQ (DUF2303 family)